MASRRTARPKAVETPAESSTDVVANDTANSGLTTLPLFSLVLSDLNVRTTDRAADIAALADDIAARGLKQNLVVVPAHFSTCETEDYGNKFEVVAGGRRLQALQLLASDGRLPHDHPVPVMVDQRDQARETSLSENLHRVAMNPADEFEAFNQIVGLHRSGEDLRRCALRFGVTERHVEGRLRLAALHPDILAALRENAIGVESAKAYALTTDQDLQLKVFAAQAKTGWKTHDPRTVRDALRGKTAPLTDTRLIYVGQVAYRAAGGRIEMEMFMGSDGDERLIDVSLLEKLCAEKANSELPALIASGGWSDAMFAQGTNYSVRQPKAPKGMVKPYEYNRQEAEDYTAEERAESVAIFCIASDGVCLAFWGRFKPEVVTGDSDGSRSPNVYVQETPEQREARAREDGIALWAARFAIGPFAGTPLEGRAFYPVHVWNIRAIDEEEEGALVAIQIRVNQTDIDAARDRATEHYDTLRAEQLAAKAARDAALDAEDDEPGEFSEDEEECEA